MQLFLQNPTALSDTQIAEVYARAEEHSVGIGLYGGTPSPSRGPAQWMASGNALALRRFRKSVGFDLIGEPSYPDTRWTDKNRWE